MGKSITFNRGSVKPNGKVEEELKSIFGNIGTVRQMLRSIRKRMGNDEAILQHINLLRDAGWSPAQIKTTLCKGTLPSTQELIEMVNLLIGIGFSSVEASHYLVERKHVAHVESSADLKERILLVYNGNPPVNNRPKTKSAYLTSILTTPMSTLRTIHETLLSEKTQSSEWVDRFFKILPKTKA